MTSLTASWSLPPSVVNSFWYSMKTNAVSAGSSEKSTMFRIVFEEARGFVTTAGAKAETVTKKAVIAIRRSMVKTDLCVDDIIFNDR